MRLITYRGPIGEGTNRDSHSQTDGSRTEKGKPAGPGRAVRAPQHCGTERAHLQRKNHKHNASHEQRSTSQKANRNVIPRTLARRLAVLAVLAGWQACCTGCSGWLAGWLYWLAGWLYWLYWLAGCAGCTGWPAGWLTVQGSYLDVRSASTWSLGLVRCQRGAASFGIASQTPGTRLAPG